MPMLWQSVLPMLWNRFPAYVSLRGWKANQLFLTMPRAETDRMLQTYFFYFWNEEADEIRLVTSFDTTEEDIDTFIRILKK